MNIPAEFKIATSEQSRQLDTATIEKFGIDSFTLMEVAGSSAAKKILETVESGSNGVVLCGKGNNGGDALVVARYLVQHGIAMSIVFIGGADELSPDAKKNYNLLQSIKEQDSNAKLNFCTSWYDFNQAVMPDFIVDGMLGTGLDSDLRDDYVDAVDWANKKVSPVFAMDIPTGLHGDSGKVMGDAIEASKTFAFGTLKQGFYLGSGHDYTGDVCYCELPFPDFLKQDISTFLMDDDWLPEHQPKKARHKYENVVYVVAGSEGISGAAILAAKSAWRTGAGAVILVCPRGILPVFENNLSQIIKKPVGQRDDTFFESSHLQAVRHIIQEKQGTVLLGPGLGRKETTSDFVNELLAGSKRNFVIDADGLWALSQQSNWEKPDNVSWTLTPHPGELSRLFNVDIKEDVRRLEEVREQSAKRGITLLSKGFPVMLGAPDNRLYLTGYDTRIFSRAGFGDVLAGKIASFNALGYSPAGSCIRALLDGRARAKRAIEDSSLPVVEPMDLL